MKSALACLLSLSFAAISPLAAQDEEVALFKVKEEATVGKWSITSFSRDGKKMHAMMGRSYDDGTLLRYFFGEGRSTLMFYDAKVFPAFPAEAPTSLARFHFTGSEGDTPDIAAAASLNNGLTNEQDAMVRIDVDETTDFLAALVEANALTISIKGYTHTFDLKGSEAAASALLKAMETSTKPNDSKSLKDIALDASTPAVVWDLNLRGGASKVYRIQGKAGQSMKLGFIEDSRNGMVDVGKASVEEGFENAMILKFKKDRVRRLTVSNPSKEPMDFRIFVSLE